MPVWKVLRAEIFVQFFPSIGHYMKRASRSIANNLWEKYRFIRRLTDARISSPDTLLEATIQVIVITTQTNWE